VVGVASTTAMANVNRTAVGPPRCERASDGKGKGRPRLRSFREGAGRVEVLRARLVNYKVVSELT
jgi:hypothetical protein